MSPNFQHPVFEPTCSFRIEQRTPDCSDPRWHSHAEIELALVVSGTGQLLTDRCILPVQPGDLLLLGSYLPHAWRLDSEAATDRPGRFVFIHLREVVFGGEQWTAPEFGPIRSLIDCASSGLHLGGAHARCAAIELRLLHRLHGPAAFAQLLLVFDHLARAERTALGDDSRSISDAPTSRDRRLGRVAEYLRERFREPVTLPEIARIAAMSPPAFSRYFKHATGKNVSEFVSELRVGYAAVRLLESDAKIGDIALDAGFETLSSFNRQFLRLRRMQPRRYRDEFRKACTVRAAWPAAPAAESMPLAVPV